MSAAAAHTRGAVQSLRSLLVEIYPASLKEAGLDSALRGLTASLAARGIDTTVHIEADLSLSDDNEALVFRVAQEALRNVVRHAGASAVSVTLFGGSFPQDPHPTHRRRPVMTSPGGWCCWWLTTASASSRGRAATTPVRTSGCACCGKLPIGPAAR